LEIGFPGPHHKPLNPHPYWWSPRIFTNQIFLMVLTETCNVYCRAGCVSFSGCYVIIYGFTVLRGVQGNFQISTCEDWDWTPGAWQEDFTVYLMHD
jgi:hypothetical protein